MQNNNCGANMLYSIDMYAVHTLYIGISLRHVLRLQWMKEDFLSGKLHFVILQIKPIFFG